MHPSKAKTETIIGNQDVAAFTHWCTEAANSEDMEELCYDYRIHEHPYLYELSWNNRCRLLYNRMVGYHRNYRKYRGDPLSRAMDANKALWREHYDDYRNANPDAWMELVLAVNDTLQQHGHDGVWGGNVTYPKVAEAYSYRSLYHDDRKAAYNEEFYSLLFGWW